ncbi:hypothetical protein [Nocardia sp. NPDC023988]|uniref:hypothetical protein n=1 Tax=unclassified Nocardia TaxID=2637762 RepID=UPI0033DF8E54
MEFQTMFSERSKRRLLDVDLESLLDYIETHQIAVAITPTYRHIQNNPTWVRTRCDLITTDPPSYQRRQQRLVVS